MQVNEESPVIDPLWKRILYFVLFMVGFPLAVILAGALIAGLVWLFLIGWRLVF